MNKDFINVNINSKQDLFKALNILSCGQVSGENGIIYNKNDKSLDIFAEFTYFGNGGLVETKKVLPFVHKNSYLVVKSNLHLSNIETFEKKRKRFVSEILIPSSKCKVKKDKYTLVFHEGIEIVLSFKENVPLGFLRDLEIIEGKKDDYLGISWNP